MIQGTNDFGRIGYGGPCPPRGQTHRYFFRVYGLDTKINLPPGANASQLKKAIDGHVVQYGETCAKYGR
jgi:Raf kinase inhibitor-like YbhB/YbcL family protein